MSKGRSIAQPHAGHRAVHDTISKATDSVLEEVKAWQSRPLKELYPIIYLHALVVKVRDGHQFRSRCPFMGLAELGRCVGV